jgi:hypothetical protein
MSGLAHQIDVLDPPRRLFFMTTRMKGLPVAVLHDYTPKRRGCAFAGHASSLSWTRAARISRGSNR